MATKIFVNLPVKDLNRSIDFFKQLGFKFNPQFTDKNSTCMIVSDDIYVMMLTEPFFQTFTKKQICDATKGTEVIVTLSADNREKVDEVINKAIKAGAATPNKTQDQGWMYGRGFQDLDGHLWEIIWMDPAQIKSQENVEEADLAE